MANVVLTLGQDNSPKIDSTDNVLYRDVDVVVDSNTNIYYDKEYHTYTVKQLIDINAIANSLNNIFSWIPGERVLDPEFGTNLNKLLFEGITASNSERIQAEVSKIISKYEPRVQIVNLFDISTVANHENNTIALRVVYSIPTLPGQQFSYDYFAMKR